MLPVAILAGGLATRLGALTEKTPKALVEVAGEPFLVHQLRLLHSRGVQRVVICAGYLGDMILDCVGDGAAFGLRVEYSFDGPVLRGTAGALHQALPCLGEQFLTLYGDSYLPVDYEEVARRFVESGRLGMMTVYRNNGQWDSSNVQFNNGRIVRYDKKNRTAAMCHIDYGLGGFHRGAFDHVGTNAVYDLATLYQELLAQDELLAIEVKERFYEVGSLAGIAELTEKLNHEFHRAVLGRGEAGN
jgi:NDP-sugar pyrophosphorylase family protein